MNSEWIEKLRAAAAMCRSPDDDRDYKYWAAVAFGMLPKALEHIDQQAASLDEAEALIRKNADMINGYLARITELEALRSDAARMTKRANELETTIREKDDEIALLRNGYSTKIAQVAALQEIAVEERARYLEDYIHEYDPSEDRTTEARRQLAEEHPEVDWK